jgi:RNA polymerase sigma-70 factor, ECF subfamily
VICEAKVAMSREAPASGSEGEIDTTLEDLVAQYTDALFRFALALTGDRDAAADCAQHAFVRAWEQIRRGRAVNRTWLYTVTRNAGIDYLRHRGREPVRVDDLALLEAPSVDTSSGDVTVRAAVARLAPTDREVLYLYVVDRFRTAEIASMLGITAEATRMRISRAVACASWRG